MTADPLYLVPEAAEYAKVGLSTVRKCYGLPAAHPHHLHTAKHFGRVKIRQSWLDDWITRTSEDL